MEPLIGKNKEIDIAQNLRVIEWLKADLVDSTGVLLKSLLKKGDDRTGDALAAIIIICYLLGRRVGVNFTMVDARIKNKLNNSFDNAADLEQWNADLTELQNYLGKKR
ncbi:MAG TPA: MazG-like family protein [Syntrophomonadaceae bacterium]|nr:MazG-like family protein [Syntrophomonadaceae bacterium]